MVSLETIGRRFATKGRSCLRCIVGHLERKYHIDYS